MSVINMRAGYVQIGFIIFFVGFLFSVYMWPLIAFETEDTFDINEVEEGDNVRYKGSITDIDRSGDIYILELDSGVLEAYTKQNDFEEDQKVLVTIEFGSNATNYDENTYLVQPFPTMEGIVGMVFTFIGIGIILVGAGAKKQRLEDVLKFESAPPLEVPEQPETETAEGVQQVTCPSCRHVFGVSGVQRPARITCPECGTSGIVE
jgi:hypothetical protein